MTWNVRDELDQDGNAVIDVSCKVPEPLEYVTFDPTVVAAFNEMMAKEG